MCSRRASLRKLREKGLKTIQTKGICWLGFLKCILFQGVRTFDSVKRKEPIRWHPLQRQNAENLKQIFPEKDYRGLSPNSTFMCLWSNYIFPRWSCRFCWRKYVDRSWDYINRSQTHECGNWGWGRAIPRKGIHKRNCRCSACKRSANWKSGCHPTGACHVWGPEYRVCHTVMCGVQVQGVPCVSETQGTYKQGGERGGLEVNISIYRLHVNQTDILGEGGLHVHSTHPFTTQHSILLVKPKQILVMWILLLLC